MDTLKYEQIKELQEHRPINYGTLKMTAAVTVTLILLANCIWFGFSIMKQLTGKVPGDLNAGIGVLFVVVTMLGIGIYATNGARGQWLRGYWRRNVRGYVARFYRNSASERPLQYVIATPQENQDLADSMIGADLGEGGAFAIGLPLNGKPAQLMHTNRDALKRLAGWSVRLRAILDTGAVMVEIRKHNRFWGVDERIVTDIGSALRYLEEIATTTGSASSSVSNLVHWMNIKLDSAIREHKEIDRRMTTLHQIIAAAYHYSPDLPARPVADVVEDNLRHLIAECHAARGEVNRYVNGFLPAAIADRDAARKELEKAITLITDLAREVETSDRLSGTIAGLRLLDRMLDWLCLVALQGSSAHRALQDRLAVVRAKLAEKERRDRAQHNRTKPATPPAVSTT